jgi:hypothetical protein
MGVGAILAIVCVVGAYYSVRGAFSSEGAAISADRMFIDASTGKAFEHEIKSGEYIPVKAPSGGNTGYPAEACYWTKDGKVKDQPTFVLLNSTKGMNEATFCPDCGRLVVGHNPHAMPGATPPPTKEEYIKRHGGTAERRSP